MIEDIRHALRANSNEGRVRYWRGVSVLADNDSTDDQRAEALRDVAAAANEIGATAEDIDGDIALLRERQASPDLDALQRDADNEARQLQAEAATHDADAAGAEARARELRQQAEAKRGRAGHVRTSVNNAKQADRRLRQQLADRGCPTAVIELAVAEQQRQLVHARGAVDQAEKELADAVAVLERANSDHRRQDRGHDPLRDTVERLQRDLARARRALAEIEARVEVEAEPAAPESRADRTRRHATAAAGLGRRRSGTRS